MHGQVEGCVEAEPGDCHRGVHKDGLGAACRRASAASMPTQRPEPAHADERMAEGAIDGEAESYEVAGPYANALRLLSLRRTEAGAAPGGAPGARTKVQGTLTATEAPVALAARAEDQSVCMYVGR